MESTLSLELGETETLTLPHLPYDILASIMEWCKVIWPSAIITLQLASKTIHQLTMKNFNQKSLLNDLELCFVAIKHKDQDWLQWIDNRHRYLYFSQIDLTTRPIEETKELWNMLIKNNLSFMDHILKSNYYDEVTFDLLSATATIFGDLDILKLMRK